ncbi:protein of unknown function DUF1555 [Rippkaea orientalis PCC 8801]|uniref:Ice-binding protein C-terminal domain-containing protein n=1 Tax=Rippkaea orientalis (strain PCC 8801 / RF-1) TaxID=41431 RepID=B7K3B6_RIPO1|nr:PEP-CTERM sorting domain-containing protein [Rippkaea orientalis]ACK64436.1 protein of unknown function DUF1555 [Rippkaea orientalis PCC 8801]
MNTIKSLTRGSIIVGGFILGLGTPSVLAADFKTTFTLDVPGGNPLVDTVVINWSTDLTSGIVSESDLTNWSYELLGLGSSVYSETVIVGGVVQPIGGVARTVSDLLFEFDLDTLTSIQFDNDVNVLQELSASGLTYNTYLNLTFGDGISVDQFFDGAIIEVSVDDSTFSQVTTVSSIPEPSTLLGLLAMGSLGVLSRKRQG